MSSIHDAFHKCKREILVLEVQYDDIFRSFFFDASHFTFSMIKYLVEPEKHLSVTTDHYRNKLHNKWWSFSFSFLCRCLTVYRGEPTSCVSFVCQFLSNKSMWTWNNVIVVQTMEWRRISKMLCVHSIL